MCGLFGVVRAGGDRHPERVTDALLMLGVLAEERGRDAAGMAFVTAGTRARRWSHRAAAGRDVTIGGCRVVKRPGAFRRLWRPEYAGLVEQAAVVLGHTRWATQGSARDVVNASPLLVGSVLGTHNGDVDVDVVGVPFDWAPVGGTDTEPLLAALCADDGNPTALVASLERVRGRAALVWVDVRDPGRVWMARAAISPLAIGQDVAGNLWWVSNPDWLRMVEAHTPLRMRWIRMLREGSLLSVRARAGAPRLGAARSFQSWARPRDVRLADVVAYRGFTAADRDADRANSSRMIAAATWEGRRGTLRAAGG